MQEDPNPTELNNALTALILLKILIRRLCGRMNTEIEEGQFEYRRGKGSRDAIG